MQLFSTVAELRQYLDTQAHRTVGLVPTMGALHAGHLSLIERARRDCDRIIVSIFVNPLQFGPQEDFARYPRSQAQDRALCRDAAVDALFVPTAVDLYGLPQPSFDRLTQVVPPARLTDTLCGKSRPGHFQGVATVVTKLLNIVRPTYAYFGQKDAQQVAVLKQLVEDLNLPGKIITCPIVREPDGLAMSSRNRYLFGSARHQATILYRSLQTAKVVFTQGERSAAALIQAAQEVLATDPTVRVDYLALVHPDTLEPLQAVDTLGMMAIAAHIEQAEGNTRLIDNILLQNRAPIIAIDGPAGAGKSTVARQLAHQLGLLYLDTGAMYRALTWYVLQQQVDPANEAAVADLLPDCHIRLTARVLGDQPQPPRVQVNGQDVTEAIRSAEVTAQVSTIAAQSAVRAKLVEQQQRYGREGGIVADGRDIGTQVFPNAELKIFLTASVQERADRRYRDLQASDQPLPAIDELAHLIAERDRKDSTRAISPLRKAPDAIEIVTDALTVQQVVGKIASLYRQATASPTPEKVSESF